MKVKDLVEMYLESLLKRRSANTYRFYSGRLAAFVKRFGQKSARPSRRDRSKSIWTRSIIGLMGLPKLPIRLERMSSRF